MITEHLKLDPDEQVVMLVRKHWFILATKIFGFVFSALFPLVFVVYALHSQFLAELEIDAVALGEAATFFSTAWFIVMWMMVWSVFTDYYLDVWTITTRRIIAVDQRGLFHRSVSSFRLEKLQDLNIRVDGFIATTLNFGTIEAETASHDDNFVIHGAPNPAAIKAAIQECADKLLLNTRAPQAAPAQAT